MNKFDLQKQIDGLYEGSSALSIGVNSFSTSLKEKDISMNLLQAWLADSEWLAESAKLSYEHILGFDKLVILSSRELGYKLRLHIWWPQQDKPYIEGLHNHRWDFGSVMLMGDYLNEFYVKDDHKGEEMLEYQCASSEGKSTFNMQLLGKTKVRKIYEGTIRAGDHYYISHDVIHRISKKIPSLTATFILQTEPKEPILVHISQKRIS